MRKLVAVFAVVVFVSYCLTAADAQESKTVPTNSTTATSSKNQVKTSVTQTSGPMDKEIYGYKLLEIAEADAGGLKAGMRAWACLQLAIAYKQSDKNKALELLDSALIATREIDPKPMLNTRAELQQDIAAQLVSLAPQRAEGLLNQVEPGARLSIFNALLLYYRRKHDINHQIEIVNRIAADGEFPYAFGLQIMDQLPPDSPQILDLFTAAFSSYRTHNHRVSFVGSGYTFDSMVVKYADRIPPTLTRDAILEIFRQAREWLTKEGKINRISVGSAKGDAITLDSMYDYFLFELVPVLRRIDPEETDRLLQENIAVKAALHRYPDGMAAVSPDGGGAIGRVGPAGNMSEYQAGTEQESRAAKCVADAEAHPHDALACLTTISDTKTRLGALLQIARRLQRKNSTVAMAALRQASELAPKQSPDEEILSWINIATLYMHMQQTDAARIAVEKGLAASERAYKGDNNPDDPNRALKAYWPSTNGYRRLLRLAGQVSPLWAISLTKEMEDPEVRFVAEIGLAGEWLKVPIGTSRIVDARKKTVKQTIDPAEED